MAPSDAAGAPTLGTVPTLLVVESRDEVAAAIGSAAESLGARVKRVACLEEVVILARFSRPAAALINLGFARRSGIVAALAVRGLVPDALILAICEPSDAALVPAALRVGLGRFLVKSAPEDWVSELMPSLCHTAASLALLREKRASFEPADSAAFNGPIELSAILVDVESAVIRAALSHAGTIRGAARLLRLHERTLRGRIEKLGIQRSSEEALGD